MLNWKLWHFYRTENQSYLITNVWVIFLKSLNKTRISVYIFLLCLRNISTDKEENISFTINISFVGKMLLVFFLILGGKFHLCIFWQMVTQFPERDVNTLLSVAFSAVTFSQVKLGNIYMTAYGQEYFVSFFLNTSNLKNNWPFYEIFDVLFFTSSPIPWLLLDV